MDSGSAISKSTSALRNYIEDRKYSGFDPYDGLNAPLFNIKLLKRNKKLRFLFQQFIKRSPVDLRPVLGIKPAVNPVTLGLYGKREAR
jgi:hypothetical protein